MGGAARLTSDRPLNVLVVAACPFPYPRGTPVRALRMSQAIARRGHRVRVITYHLGQGEVPANLDVRRIPRIATYRKTAPGPSPQKLLVVDPILARTLRREMAAEPADIVHAHHYEGLLTSLWSGVGGRIPIVYDAHTLLSSEVAGYRIPLPSSWLEAAGRRLDRSLPRRADHVIAVTDALAKELTSYGVPAGDVTVASQGIEEEFFVPLESEASVPLDPASPTLVYAGNLASYQGIQLLLEAFARVRAAREDVRLRLLTGSSFQPYEERARHLGVRDAVEIEGVSLDELPAAIQRADVAVNPRVACHGFPIKLLNYMAAARPVVSFEGSAPVVRHGETGLLVEGSSIEGFAGAVLELLADPSRARRIGLAGRRYVESHHRWDGIATRVEDVYRKLVSR